MNVLFLLDLLGVAVFAISGALAAGERRMDAFGVVVLALVTALGGGTLRDLVIGRTPVFWIHEPLYIFIGGLFGLATFFLAHHGRGKRRYLELADALGLAVFTVIGAQVALAEQLPGVIAVVMGVMTGVAGGIIRDVLAGRVPLIFRQEIYATAALSGAVTMVVLEAAQLPGNLALLLAGTTTLVIRLLALRYALGLPRFPGSRG